MNSKIICAHHGSPGSSRDFFHLKLILPEYHFIFTDRIIDPDFDPTHDQDNIQLGYSFGSVHAIISGSKNKKTSAIILIAPYLFPEKKPSKLMCALFNFDNVSNLILNKIAPKKISEMLEKSSHPKKVFEHYLKDSKEYLNPKRLKHSILEKKYDTTKLFSALKTLEKNNIPIHVLFGDSDLTSEYKNAVEPLLKYSNVTAHKIVNAGHALLWTHTEELGTLIRGIIMNKKENEKLGYFEGVHEKNNVSSFLSKHLKEFPDRKILTWVDYEALKKWNGDLTIPLPHKSVTVKELDYYVGILASEFKKLGIEKNDRVILFLPMSLYMYASMFALQKIGAIPTFLDSWARRDQMGSSCKVAMPKAMISAHKAYMYLGDIEEIKNIPIKIVALDVPEGTTYTARLEELLQGKDYSGPTAVEKEHTALITFTTGSSGTPKGADRSHRFLAAQHYALNRHLPYEKTDLDLPVFPIFSLNNLAAGVETIIPAIDVGTPSDKDSLILYAQMKSIGVTCTTLSPSLFNNLSQFCLDHNLKLDFLKRVVTGGAPISRDDVERMKKVASNAEILVLYGSTEVEPMAHIEAMEMLKEKRADDPEIVEPGVNVGHLDNGLKYKFIEISKDPIYINKKEDWSKIEVAHNKVGELIVAGEHVCEKYYNNEDAFFRAKIKDENNIIWHRTGDLGVLDKDKNLWIVGRVHNAIKRDRDWYFPVKAEIILKKFDFVSKAAFLGVPDEKINMRTYAVFSTKEGMTSIDRYIHEIKRVLEKNDFIVDMVVHVDDIPMDPRHHSKVEYDILRKIVTGK